MPCHSSAIAPWPVRTGLTATIFAPRAFNLPSPSLIGFESWSSATPHSIRYCVWSQSDSPNSQNEPPSVYSPPAAMLTEQNPPCAAWLLVPTSCAHQPVSACTRGEHGGGKKGER